jgi:hypothetical protein
MKWVADNTGRFSKRPFYLPEELDTECERIVSGYLRAKYGAAAFPISTDDLSVMVEHDTSDLDLFADLSVAGEDVEGLTDFFRDKKPAVKISKELSLDGKQNHRLRTTLAHEYGHVKFHYFLWDMNFKAEKPANFLKILARQRRKVDAFRKNVNETPLPRVSGPQCRHALMIDAPADDWMEWQAAYAGGALLMPAGALRDYVTRGNRGGDLTEAVAQKFDVSLGAAVARLKQLGFLPETGGDNESKPVKDTVNFTE